MYNATGGERDIPVADYMVFLQGIAIGHPAVYGTNLQGFWGISLIPDSCTYRMPLHSTRLIASAGYLPIVRKRSLELFIYIKFLLIRSLIPSRGSNPFILERTRDSNDGRTTFIFFYQGSEDSPQCFDSLSSRSCIMPHNIFHLVASIGEIPGTVLGQNHQTLDRLAELPRQGGYCYP